VQALERAVKELVLGPELRTSDASAVEAWLRRNAVDGADAEALRSELGRLTVYRGLVRARLREAVELAVPRTRARLGPLFDEYFARFLAERGPRSHYLRDVTSEFLDFVTPLAAGDARMPAWALELARHEALDVLVGSLAESPEPGALSELDPERGLVFSATARVVRSAHAVHRLSADPDDRSEPERVPTALFVHRSRNHEVRYLELTPLAAAILERLLGGRPLRGALEDATRELGVALDPSVLDGTARVLAELAERGAVIGALDGQDASGDLQNGPRPAENARKNAPPRTG
jgi:hypothetical protein